MENNIGSISIIASVISLIACVAISIGFSKINKYKDDIKIARLIELLKSLELFWGVAFLLSATTALVYHFIIH